MNICVKCRREMICLKTGAVSHFGNGHCYAGDIFKCNDCGSEVLVCVSQSHRADVELLKFNNCTIVDMVGRQ